MFYIISLQLIWHAQKRLLSSKQVTYLPFLLISKAFVIYCYNKNWLTLMMSTQELYA